MLDWQEVTTFIQHAETLSVEDLISELAELRDTSPNIGHEVTEYFARKNRAVSFMQTSVPNAQANEPVLPNGTLLGVWKILSHIGSGGMGDVYKAERSDGLYSQVVALKVIQRRDLDSLHRFEEERKRLANLEHPGISRIIDGGATNAGHPFMVMEYVDGKPIDEYILSEDLNRPHVLTLIKTLCESVSHAHSRLILHRDIKTKNVLVDASGSAKLIDFGIASVMGETSDMDGGPMTIAYAAPEQLMRNTPSVGTDIFALGVLMHELLTGKPQSRNSDGSVTTNEHALKDADLSAIISKATAFEENDRYQSVTAMMDDILAYLERRPVTARNGNGLYRFKRRVQRNKVASLLTVVSVVALTGGMFTSLVMAKKATGEAERANAELIRSEWLAGESQTFASIGFSTKDAFQYAFSQEADKGRFNDRLIEYLNEIPDEERKKMPDVVATKNFAVASHFLSGNDYATAREILEPWIAEGTGSDHMIALGRGSLAYTYVDAGQRKLAGDMFSKAAAYYEGTPGEDRQDYTNYVIQSALMLEDEVGAEKARKVIDDALKTEKSPWFRMYLISQLQRVEYQQGNWDAALKAQVKVIEEIENGSIGTVAGTDSMYLVLARLYIFHRQDVASALVQIEKAQLIADTKKGESKELGLIHELRAVLAWTEKDYVPALENISKSFPIYEKYSGKKDNYARALALQGIIQTEMGDYVAASKSLEALNTDHADTAGQWPALLNLYIVARQDSMESAQILYDDPNFDKDKLNKGLQRLHYLKALQEDGLEL